MGTAIAGTAAACVSRVVMGWAVSGAGPGALPCCCTPAAWLLEAAAAAAAAAAGAATTIGL